jgi:hypothetical protein
MSKEVKYSRENGNMNIVSNDSQSKKPKVVINTLNVLTKERKVLGRSKKMRWTTDMVLILVIAIVLFLGVSYLIRSYSIGKNIILDSRAINERVSSGNLETFELSYKNDNRESIHDASISFELPGNFILEEVLPSDVFDQNTNTINLGDLVSGANGKVKVSGFVLGEVGSQQFINFSLNYSKDGLHRTRKHSLLYLIEDSVFDFKFSLPTEVYQGVLFSKQLVLHNRGQRNLENIKIIFDQNIEIHKVDKFSGLSFDINNIYLNELKENEKIFLDLDLLIKNAQGPTSLNIISEANGLRQKSLDIDIFVEVPKFKISIVPDKGQMVAGEYLNFRVNYQNNEDQEIQNVSLDLKALVNFVIKDLEIKDQTRFKQDGHTIHFKNNLASGEKGSFNIRVLVQRNKAALNQETGLSANINYTHQGKYISYPSHSTRVKLCSNLNVKSAGYYYSPQGDQLGTGPVPPIVDISTNYWVFWEIDNFGNNLSSFSLSADLPEELVWINNKSVLAGNLQYGEISRRVIWNIDEVSAQNGKYQAKFELGLIPEEGDVGKTLDLLKNIQFSVQDNFCGTKILGSKENINTNLKDDNFISGKGKVEEFK